MSLIRKIKDYYNKNLNVKGTLFTTPSHSQGRFIIPDARKMLGEKFFKCDFSEIEGFDNLRAPNGILRQLQKKLSQIYKSKKTFLLTNGSTSGIIAIMNAVLKENDKVLVARNCHESVYNGLVISGAVPVWFMPKFNEKWGVFEGVSSKEIESKLKNNPDIKALVLTSPTYEGIFSDISGIAAICKENDVKLIVDEAHGALLNFSDFKTKPSILCGADASVQSLHKNAGAPNPCALLHIGENSKIDTKRVQDSLNLINTTSPSYPLILAIEATVEYLNSDKGKKYIETLRTNIEHLKKSVNESIEFYEGFSDPTKLLVRIKNLSGTEASTILNEKYRTEEEFSNSQAMLFLTGIGTDKQKLKVLEKALNKLSSNNKELPQTECSLGIPEQKYTPREAYYKEHVASDIQHYLGEISAELIIKYPPGIPILIPGEVITEQIIAQIGKDTIKICK